MRRLAALSFGIKSDRDLILNFEVNKYCVSFAIHLVWVGVAGYFYWRKVGV
jgi:hypothetical protein